MSLHDPYAAEIHALLSMIARTPESHASRVTTTVYLRRNQPAAFDLAIERGLVQVLSRAGREPAAYLTRTGHRLYRTTEGELARARGWVFTRASRRR